MLEYLKQKANMTETENGAAAYVSTESDCLDLFAAIGALRGASDEEIIRRFVRAYAEDSDAAMKILFFARDVRGGLGERRVFRTILTWLACQEPESVRKNIEYIAEYGRFDDLFSLMNTPCEQDMISYVKMKLFADRSALASGKEVSLLGKWLPSVNTSCRKTTMFAKRLAKALGLREAEYRKMVSSLRKRIAILENNLREKNYVFDYAKQPSRALYHYKKAFLRNDEERYMNYLKQVSEGTVKLHADQIAPYELVRDLLKIDWETESIKRSLSEAEKTVLNATWDSLPDYGTGENALAVIDTSGSMYYNENALPAAVALSLGMYFAEHNQGRFHDHIIEFSREPQFLQVKGTNFVDKLRYLSTFHVIADTNLAAVFELILETAVKNHVPQEEMPAKLFIISDMEFNACVEDASEMNFKWAKLLYERFGYKLPEVVFWNVASRNRQQPVTKNEQGVALVSGVTPRLFAMAAGGELSPYAFMQEVLHQDRYAVIAA